jgi:hypothetical protein
MVFVGTADFQVQDGAWRLRLVRASAHDKRHRNDCRSVYSQQHHEAITKPLSWPGSSVRDHHRRFSHQLSNKVPMVYGVSYALADMDMSHVQH